VVLELPSVIDVPPQIQSNGWPGRRLCIWSAICNIQRWTAFTEERAPVAGDLTAFFPDLDLR
jgi:hypothetical protein